MRRDIDRLMTDRKLDAAVVMGSTGSSPTVHYLTGGASLEGALIIWRAGQKPLLVHSPMERDDAARTGMETVANSGWNLAAIVREMGGELLAGRAEQIRRILAEYGVRGRVGFYGHGEIGQSHALLSRLETVLDDTEMVVEFDDGLFGEARVTKDRQELDAMWEVARRANAVVAEVADMLSSRPVSGSVLQGADGEPLTIGQVKRFVHDQCVAARPGAAGGEHLLHGQPCRDPASPGRS